METMKKNNKAYTATCYSPFTDVVEVSIPLMETMKKQ